MKKAMKKTVGIGVLSLIALSAVSLFAVCRDKCADGSCITEHCDTSCAPETRGDSGDDGN